MNKGFVQDWLNKLKKYWFNKDIEKAVSLFAKTSFYQETPFMKAYTTLEEINEEYDIQNIFDKRKNKVSTEDDINKETLPVVINEEKWYKKIFNFIRKLIKR